MKIGISSIASTVASACVLALVGACGSAPPSNVAEAPGYTAAPVVQYGYVRDITTVQTESRSSNNHGGAILGAVIGAVAGNQIGEGNGNKAAIAAGAIGGAVVGNHIQNRNRREDEVYRVNVRFDDGREAAYDFQRVDALRVGDRVKYEGGQLYRL